MAYKKLSEVDIDSSFDHILVTSGGVVKQVSDVDINSHYNIDGMSEAIYSGDKNKAVGIVGELQNDLIVINDSSDGYLRGLNIYGKSNQNGTPTPAAPIDIVNIGDSGNVTISVCGRNIVPMSVFNSMFSNGASNVYDPSTHTITMSEDVTTNVPSGRYCVPHTPVLKIGVTYTLSFDIKGTPGKIVSCGWDRNRVNVTLTDQFKRYNFTRVADSNNLAISFYTINTADGGLGTNEYVQFANVQIEIADTATEYEVYVEPQILTLSTPNGLPGVKVDLGGNYTDQNGQQWICDEIDLESGIYIQRIRKLILDGTETWNKSSNDDNVYAYHLGLYDHPINASSLCDKLVATDGVNSLLVEGQTSDILGYFVSKKYNVLYINLGYYMTENTPAEVQSVLSGNPITVYYPMATPIEIHLSDVEMSAYKAIRTKYLGTTIINDVEAHMKVSYNIDTKTYIDNKFEELKAMITS